MKAFLSRSRDVRLTVDAPFQAAVARILWELPRALGDRARRCRGNQPDTGDLLASGSYPFPSDDDSNSGGEDESEALINGARFGLYPPGSPFKLVTASAALRKDLSSSDTTFICSLQTKGRVGARVGRWGVIRDDVLDTRPHGTLDMHDGLVHWCNAYFAQLAVRVGPAAILETANLLGISVAPDDSLARLRATLPWAG